MFSNIFIADLSNVIKLSKYVPFTDDFNIFGAINSVDDCILPQSDIEVTQGWFTANFMKLTVAKLELLLAPGQKMTLLN